jgi:curved DNA-binding protein CbpA
MTSLYDVLGVSRKATPEEIKSAYRQKAKTMHPDVGGDADDWADLNSAYTILSEEDSRAHYDATGKIKDAQINSPKSEALAIIAQCTQGIIMQMGKSGIYTDVVVQLKQVLSQNVHQIAQQEQQEIKKKKGFEAYKGRFLTKNPNNIFEHMLNSVTADTDRNIAVIQENKQRFELALELLSEYEFKIETDTTSEGSQHWQSVLINQSLGGQQSGVSWGNRQW